MLTGKVIETLMATVARVDARWQAAEEMHDQLLDTPAVACWMMSPAPRAMAGERRQGAA